MKTISTALANVLENRAGIPTFRVSVYDTNFAYPSKGFNGKYYNYNQSGLTTALSDYLKEEGAKWAYNDDEVIWIYGNYYVSGTLLRSQYDSHMMFNWGDNPPLGILPDQLNNKYSYTAKWSGLFYADKPGRYFFAYISTSLAAIRVNSITVMQPGIAHQINKARDEDNNLLKRRPVLVTRPTFLPITVFFSRQRHSASGTNPKHKVKERFACFWKHDDDNDWKILDCSQVVHGLDFTNTRGQLITNVAVIESGRFDPDDRFDFELQANSTISNSYDVYVNDVYHGATGVNEVHELTINEAKIKVTFGYHLSDGDRATVWGPRFLSPLVSVHGLPLVKSIKENRAEGQSTTYSFDVPLTQQPYDKNNISSTNCYSYNTATESYGVLRKNRLIDIYQGYSTDDDESLYHRFRGFIDDVQIDHQATEASLTINCRDVSKLCIDGRITSLPNQLSYDIANITPSNVNITQADGNIRPIAYDGWKVVQAVRDLGYNAGLTSAQLFAESNNRYLIDDLDDTLDKTGMYPYTRQVMVDGTIREAEYIWKPGLGETYWDYIHKIATFLGRQLNITLEGNLELRAPDNPTVVANYTDDSNINSIEFNSDFHGPVTANTADDSARCLKGYYYKVESGHPLSARFSGTGVSLVVSRFNTDVAIRVEIDDTIVDGKNQLDSSTSDIGNTAYITKLDDDGYYNLQLENLGTGNWHYLDGVHPATNNNPTILPICSNLTSGKHTIKIYAKDEIVKVEGILVYGRNDFVPVHSFDGSKDKISLSATDSMESMRNDVLVLGARVGQIPVHARATDVASVKDPDAPNYIGYLRTAIIVLPELRNKERANFVALNTLTRYSQGSRVVSVDTIGLPFLEVFDPVSINDPKFGFNLPVQVETSLPVLYTNIVRDRQDRFWITGISSSQTHNSYTGTVETTPYPPQRAYQPVPDPPNSLYSFMYTNVEITIDGAETSTYNPFNGDRTGQLVEVGFDLLYNASMVKISVLVTNTVAYTCPFDGSIKTLQRESMVNVLKYEEGLVPRGHYRLFWDGWWADENGTGRYLLDTSIAAFRFEAIRYNDQKAFAPIDTSHIVATSPYYDNIGEVKTVTMDYDRTVFTTSTSVTTTGRSTTADGSSYAGPVDVYIYDDEQSQPNNTGRLKITVTNGIPGTVHIKFRVMLLQKVNVGGDPVLVYDKIVAVVQDDEPRDVGSYDFYFNPSTMIPPEGLKKTVTWTRRNPVVLRRDIEGQTTISSEDRFSVFTQNNQSSLPSIPFNFRGLVLPNPTDVLYSCWLIRASSVQLDVAGDPDTVYYQFPDTGIYLADKSLYLHGFTTGTDPTYYVWMGNYQQFDTYLSTAVARTIFPDDLSDALNSEESITSFTLPFVQVT